MIFPYTSTMLAVNRHLNNTDYMLMRRKTETVPLICTPEELGREMGFVPTPGLIFSDELTEQKVRERCAKALRKEWVIPEQKWLGVFYEKEILTPVLPDVAIEWIHADVGYGVVANCAISPRSYLGEYAGLVRKRIRRLDNDYCFDYSIGAGRSSAFVIDAQERGNFVRFINHSDTPNLEPASVLCGGMMHIILYALKPIAKGTELTYNYGEGYWKNRKFMR
jgi:hypothetical protein